MHHGAFCLAGCWALMALLLGFGLMNLAAMAFVAFIVFAERTWPWGPTAGRVVGIAALALAVAVIAYPGLAPALHGHTHSAPMMMTTLLRRAGPAILALAVASVVAHQAGQIIHAVEAPVRDSPGRAASIGDADGDRRQRIERRRR